MNHRHLWEKGQMALSLLKDSYETPPSKGRDIETQLAMRTAVEVFGELLHFWAGVNRRAEQQRLTREQAGQVCSLPGLDTVFPYDLEEQVLWPNNS